MLPAVREEPDNAMALAYNHQEISARELKQSLLELDGISHQTIEAHYVDGWVEAYGIPG